MWHGPNDKSPQCKYQRSNRKKVWPPGRPKVCEFWCSTAVRVGVSPKKKIYPPGHRKKGERDAGMNGHVVMKVYLWSTLTVDGCFMVWAALASKKHTTKTHWKMGGHYLKITWCHVHNFSSETGLVQIPNPLSAENLWRHFVSDGGRSW